MGRECKIPPQCIIRGTASYVMLMSQPSAPLVILLNLLKTNKQNIKGKEPQNRLQREKGKGEIRSVLNNFPTLSCSKYAFTRAGLFHDLR